MVPQNWKVKKPPGHVGLLMPVTQHVQKGLIILIIKKEFDW